MKRSKKNKGQVRIIEAILASFLIFIAVSFISTFAVTPLSSTYETGELERIGHNVLHDLDEQRLLGSYIYNPEWGNLTLALMVCLPPDVYFNLTVYDLYSNPVNVQDGNYVQICYGDPEVFETSTSVASVTYIIPGYSKYPDHPIIYDPRILILRMVRG